MVHPIKLGKNERMSYSQIAKVLARDEKSTDNALQRLKAKIKKAVKKS